MSTTDESNLLVSLSSVEALESGRTHVANFVHYYIGLVEPSSFLPVPEFRVRVGHRFRVAACTSAMSTTLESLYKLGIGAMSARWRLST